MSGIAASPEWMFLPLIASFLISGSITETDFFFLKLCFLYYYYFFPFLNALVPDDSSFMSQKLSGET